SRRATATFCSMRPVCLALGSNSRVYGSTATDAHTGKTHQLRLHMTSVGLPIHGDNFYPDFYDVAAEDYSNPLRLLSKVLEFEDPMTGRLRRFESRRTLSWPDESGGGDSP
ncbi:hypothetical protein ABT116_45875, partial [Streptomyces sp. NPDC002130]